MAPQIVDSGIHGYYSFSGETVISSLTLPLNSNMPNCAHGGSGETAYKVTWNSVTPTQIGSWSVTNNKSWRGCFWHTPVDDAVDIGTSNAVVSGIQASGCAAAVGISGVKNDSIVSGRVNNARNVATGYTNFTGGIDILMMMDSSSGSVSGGTTLLHNTWGDQETTVAYDLADGTGTDMTASLALKGDYAYCNFEAIAGANKFVPMMGANFAFMIAMVQVFPHLAKLVLPIWNFMQYSQPPVIITGDRVIIPYYDDLTVTYQEVLDRLEKPRLYLPKFIDQIMTPDMVPA